MQPKLLLPVFVLMFAGCATYVATSGQVAVRDDSAATELHFSDRDRALIADYYRVYRLKNTRPGAVKRELPRSGLLKREVVPAGVAGRSLPRDLEPRLRVLPSTHVRLLVGRDLILMERNTRVVQDILYGVAN